MIHGTIYGSLIALLAFFAVMAIRQKKPSVLWFTLYIACLGLILSTYQGDLQNFLNTIFSNPPPAIPVTIIALFYFSGARFFRTFLNSIFHSRPVDQILLAFQWLAVSVIPVNLMPNPFTLPVNIGVAGIGPLFFAGTAIFFRIKQVPNAGYVAIGWIAANSAAAICLLFLFDIIEQMPGGPFVPPALMILAMIFFSIAIKNQRQADHGYVFTDPLTGIANRRLFDHVLAIEWNRNLRLQKPISVIMADIDDFKAYNDTHEPAMGDGCLKAVARVFEKNLQRAGDLAARYGGNEFTAVLPDTIASEANFLGEKIREGVERLAILHSSSSTGKILTISMGSCTMVPNAGINPADLVLNAYNALCQARNTGRNRVVSEDETDG